MDPSPPEPGRQAVRVLSILRGSSLIPPILSALARVDPRLHLGAGAVRNAVWDALHGLPSPTPLNDVDIIYFDPRVTDKAAEREMERRLTAEIPDLPWSVKNQARMHLHNGEAPYASLEDAISKWPETATAILARLDEKGGIALIAPFGLDDLLGLRIVPTPHFRRRQEIVRERAARKRWRERWPMLKVEPPAVEAGPSSD